MQLATRMIVDESTLPFWAGLINLTKVPLMYRNRFHARARERLDADKKKQVLDYLVKAADNIRFHFKSFRLERLPNGDPSPSTSYGSTGLKNVWPEDVLFQLDWEGWYCYAFRNGEPVTQANAFPHVSLNVDRVVGHDMSNDDWLDSSISGIRVSILEFATTIGHEFAHAMVLLTLDGLPEPRLNEESIIETGFSWENFVFGGTLQKKTGRAVCCSLAQF
jgi:hypothetical protein